MKITWLGHSGFRIETGEAVLLVDPWMTGNPMFPAHRRAEALAGATHILQTHAHGDHLGDSCAIAKELGIPLVGIYDLVGWLGAKEGIPVIGFNRGGTVDLAGAKVTLVAASHSSSVSGDAGPIYGGSECGFMIAAEGRTIYVSGDTDIMADMEWMGELHAPDIGIWAVGGHFTMDQTRAAYAAKKWFNFKTLIGCHYRTMPMLAQSLDVLKAALPGVDVVEPEVMVPLTF